MTSTKIWMRSAPLEPSHRREFKDVDAMRDQWQEGTEKARRAPDTLQRSWAIETGQIEGIYRLDEAQTERLVREGFSLEGMPTQGTGQEPGNLLAILQDHLDALDAIYNEVERLLPIGRTAIRQLHQILVAHQPTYRAYSPAGQPFDARLEPGAFKTMPNNPTRPDGALHPYCPPEQVLPELDNLIAWLDAYEEEPLRYHPLAVAAWLHHRFAEIHPFADGNGRVARALTSWRLIGHGYAPMNVTRQDRTEYIDALEAADAGDPGALIDLTARLQRRDLGAAIAATKGAWSPTS